MGLPIEQITDVAQNGSPVLLQAVGRIFGLGQAERGALFDKGIPRWSMYVFTVAAGVAIGVYAQRHWPRQIDKVVGRS